MGGETQVICLEKYNDQIEVGVGAGHMAQDFFVKHRPRGVKRKQTYQHASYELRGNIAVNDLIQWLDMKKDEQYCLLRSNCQHYVQDVIALLATNSYPNSGSRSASKGFWLQATASFSFYLLCDASALLIQQVCTC